MLNFLILIIVLRSSDRKSVSLENITEVFRTMELDRDIDVESGIHIYICIYTCDIERYISYLSKRERTPVVCSFWERENKPQLGKFLIISECNKGNMGVLHTIFATFP